MSNQIRARATRLPASIAACLLVAAQSGCTSALTAAYLRDGLWDRGDHAAAPAPRDAAEPAEPPEPDGAAPSAAADRERREAALEEAMARLSRLGSLDPAVEAALVATLQRTQPEDWPVVVDEFAASLPATRTMPDATATNVSPAAADAAVGSAPLPEPPPAPAGEPAPPEAETARVDPPVAPPPATPEPPVAAAAPQPLSIRAACFASAVRGWGDVDRYASDRFRPGQEVIVYVELDDLAVRESPAGHTTCVDAALRLVDAADRTLHAWNFEPLAETGASRRRDYFARYIVRIPDSAPAGGCRVELAVTDTLAGSTALATLPLEVAAAE